MKLRSTNGRFSSGSAIRWETVTAQYIRNHILTVQNPLLDEPLQDLQVICNIERQTVELATQRRLQSLGVLEIVFTTQLNFRSTKMDHDMDKIVGEAFNREAERDNYIAALKDTGDPSFLSLTSLEVLIDDLPPIVEPEPQSKDNSAAFIGVGVAAGAAVLLGLAAFVYFRKNGKGSSTMEPTATATSALGFSTEIKVDRQDDISTLGDPVYGGGMATSNSVRDEQTASINDYDYAKSFLYAGGRDRVQSQDSAPASSASTKITTGVAATSLFGDDPSQLLADEERFDITVPPGKLGMVIDTPSGVPVVHAIKPESVLYSLVAVGDRLVKVDGEDVTAMTAVQVSKLISLKSDQDRILTFARTTTVQE